MGHSAVRYVWLLAALLCATTAAAQMPWQSGVGTPVTSVSDTIAFDAATCANSGAGCAWTGGVTTLSWSHTVTGADPFLLVCTTIYTSFGPEAVTSIAYNSVALTKIDSITASLEGNSQDTECWYLAAPATGAHTVLVTFTGVAGLSEGYSASYTGVSQTAPIDSHAIGQNTSAGTSASQATTVVASNSWLIGYLFDRAAVPSAGAGTTIRKQSSGADANSIADSNGTVATGSQSLAYTFASSTVPGIWTGSIKPGP